MRTAGKPCLPNDRRQIENIVNANVIVKMVGSFSKIPTFNYSNDEKDPTGDNSL
jgi:hypothetical protein